MVEYKLTDYRIRAIKVSDIVYPDSTTCVVWLGFAGATPGSVGPSIELSLDFPRNDADNLAALRKLARDSLPKFLREAARLAEKHLSEDGSEFQSRDGVP